MVFQNNTYELYWPFIVQTEIHIRLYAIYFETEISFSELHIHSQEFGHPQYINVKIICACVMHNNKRIINYNMCIIYRRTRVRQPRISWIIIGIHYHNFIMYVHVCTFCLMCTHT